MRKINTSSESEIIQISKDMRTSIISIRGLIAALDLGFIDRPWMDDVSNDFIYSVLATPEHQAEVNRIEADGLGLTCSVVA